MSSFVPGRLVRSRLPVLSPRATRVLVWVGGCLVAAAAARSIVNFDSAVPKPLALVAAAAVATVMLNVSGVRLFLAWIFVAPLFQESAGKSRLGHLLALALYTAPILFFSCRILIERRTWRRLWFDALPALFVGYAFASIVVTSPSTLRHSAVGNLRSFFETVALGPLLYYLVLSWGGNGLSRDRFLRVFLWSAIAQALMTTVELFTNWNLWHDTSWQQPTDTRAIGTLTNPALTGAFIGAGVATAVAVLVWRRDRSLHRLASLMVVIGLPGLMATKTRGPILATVLVVGLAVLAGSRSRVLGLGAIAFVALLIALFWPQIKASSVYQNRIDQQENIQIRLVLQTISVKLAEKRPLFGWGYDSFDRVKFDIPVESNVIPLALALKFTSHDTYLTLLVEYGLVGLVLFVLPWFMILFRSLSAARAAPDDRWFFVACVGAIAVLGMTATTLDYRFFSFVPALAWLFLGLARRESERVGR